MVAVIIYLKQLTGTFLLSSVSSVCVLCVCVVQLYYVMRTKCPDKDDNIQKSCPHKMQNPNMCVCVCVCVCVW